MNYLHIKSLGCRRFATSECSYSGSSLYNVSGAASQLFSQNKDSVRYRAIPTIGEPFEHPQRALVSAFVRQAMDQEIASQFFLDEVAGEDMATACDFLVDWVHLLTTGTSSSCLLEYRAG